MPESTLSHLINGTRRCDGAACEAIIRLGPKAADAIPVLIAFLDEQDPAWRPHQPTREFTDAVWALVSIGPAAINTLASLLQRNPPWGPIGSSSVICEAIGEIGASSPNATRAALAVLAEALKLEHLCSPAGIGLCRMGELSLPTLSTAGLGLFTHFYTKAEVKLCTARIAEGKTIRLGPGTLGKRPEIFQNSVTFA